TMWVLLITALTLGVGEILLAIFTIEVPLPVTMLMLAMLGCLMTAMMAMANTRVQSIARDHLRGRVMSVYMTVFAGTTPFGALVAGAVANRTGATGSLVLGGVVTIAAAVLVMVIYRRVGHTVSAEAETEARAGADYVPG